MKNPDWRKCIIRDDSRNVLKRIPDNSIDLILTDPPYNISRYSTGNIPLPGRTAINNDLAPWDLEEFVPSEWADELIRILKPTGNLFIFTSYNQIGLWHACLDRRFDTTNFMVWHKTNPAPKIFKAGFLNSCELIFTCWNKKHTWNFSSQKEMHNFIESPICMRPERVADPKHPAQKPLKVLRRLIEIASNKNDIIFDPFMGVGSTGVAALELGRRFIGVEINSDYFLAAKQRIDDTMNRLVTNEEIFDGKVEEAAVAYGASLFDALEDYQEQLAIETRPQDAAIIQPYLSPLIKWPGGKEKELKHILPALPDFERYFEPFVGGGAVFMAIQARKYLINDLSSELIELYKAIGTKSEVFYKYAYAIDKSWLALHDILVNTPQLVEIYNQYRVGAINDNELKSDVERIWANLSTEIISLVSSFPAINAEIIKKEVITNLVRKMKRMKVLEESKNTLPKSDIFDNIEAALKSGFYMYLRYLYNDRKLTDNYKDFHTALFLFIRNYAYSGMFRYSTKGDFNVPYGGIGYNSKRMAKKLDYYRSEGLIKHLEEAQIYNLDFEEFLRHAKPTKSDFIFLDPPYDSEFSTYAKNTFDRKDQERLANYLLNECAAKWMLIIKNTDFIYNLYNHPGINISSFDKKYIVSFMNRNNRDVTHLIITNY